MVDKQTIDLGTILRQFPEFKFSMAEFDGRLRLQKFIYLLQSFDVFLGYSYSWYIRGPYCSTLSTCGFALKDVYDKIPKDAEVEFADPDTQSRFEKFRKFISKREMDTDWLEIAASIHLLDKIGNTREQVIRHVVDKQKRFTRKQVEDIWAVLEKRELLTV